MENPSEEQISELTEKVKEYAEISKTIKITQEKLKILNKKKNEHPSLNRGRVNLPMTNITFKNSFISQ
jgi:hypothetical protein